MITIHLILKNERRNQSIKFFLSNERFLSSERKKNSLEAPSKKKEVRSTELPNYLSNALPKLFH